MIDIKEIDTSTNEGQLLLAAIAKISTESQVSKTPNQIITQVSRLRDEMGFEKFNL